MKYIQPFRMTTGDSLHTCDYHMRMKGLILSAHEHTPTRSEKYSRIFQLLKY